MEYNYPLFRDRCLKIKTKDSYLVQFKPNRAQLYFENKIKQQVQSGKPIRVFVLKARQEGITTDTAGIIFHDTVMSQNRKSAVVSHEPDSTRAIFEIYKNYYDNLPEIMRPMKRYDNARSLVFENPNEEERPILPGLRSQLSVFTANKDEGGRSQTIHNLHCSEVAFWKDGKTLMKGLLQAVPDYGNTLVIIESTANGQDGYFYNGYWAAKKGLSDYVAIFIPWFIHEEYEREGEGDLVLDDYEKWLWGQMDREGFNKHEILRKLAWRRWAIPNKCQGDVKTFMQEYPATDTEAFQKKEGLVYPEFNEDIHVIPHYEPDISENIFVGGYDFGAEHPTAYVLNAIDKYGNVYLFREMKIVGSTFEQQGREIRRIETHRTTGQKFPVVARFRGHDSGAKQAEKELKREHVSLREGIVKRELGITTIRGLLLSGKLFISDECVNTIYEFKNHIIKNEYEYTEEEDGVLKTDGDEHKDADVVKKDDDCLDAERYGITSYIHKKHKEKEQPKKIAEKIVKKDLRRSASGVKW